ncbi:hypothetical protein [Mangrovicoccus ximenensis]|uniref:hypothetical protein n=1 Tax=Mangrovicoccus ximenensis TaxID=1911570 RepID=UPI000D36FB99|nr:hypothetical protein [Mangrovicoccus ximenensis]
MPLDALIAPQRGHLFPWVPVMLALGIGGYFALPAEPPGWAAALAAGLAGLLLLASLRASESAAPCRWREAGRRSGAVPAAGPPAAPPCRGARLI